MVMCEQCGNEFHRGTLVKKEEGQYIVCPFCGYENRRIFKKRKKGARK